jgi:hypothetical protein
LQPNGLIRKLFFQLSPEHNIWGSPKSDEKSGLADEKEAHSFKSHFDYEDGRKLYSPVLEVNLGPVVRSPFNLNGE